MPGIDKAELEVKIKQLIQEYNKARSSDPSEEDVKRNLIEKLFEHLGWRTDDFEVCHREAHIITSGFVDIALKLDEKRTLFVECKRFGKIIHSKERTRDRTREEKQALKYAYGQKMPYVVLTNFERLQVFNADREILILAFDDPSEYLRRIGELMILSRERVAGNSLHAYEKQLEKHDVDLQFLEDLKRWREMLANNILENNAGNKVILDKKKETDFPVLLRIVQRMLDRLILIAYADERALIGKQGKIEFLLKLYDIQDYYAAENPIWFQEQFNMFCHQMDDKHNTTIFAKDDICEKVKISNDTLLTIMKEIEEVSFRKFDWDVLGNTYESYLGHKLELRKGEIVSDTRKELRKGKGIYYTPPKIVRYIVERTLGRRLDELYQKHGIEALKHVKDIKVLDPACGSGTFLVAAFQTIAGFYLKVNEEIEAQRREIRETKGGDLYEQHENMKHLPEPVHGYAIRILENNIYGVDLDPEAAEYATVNLIMSAFEHRGNNGKLPLILNENIKVGNSLISGIAPSNRLARQQSKISNLINMRSRVSGLDNSEKKACQKEIGKVTKTIARTPNRKLKEKYPDLGNNIYNYQAEFPEVFFKEDGTPRENPGFDVVIGNPPYVRQEALGEFKEFLKEHFKAYSGMADLYVYFFERGIDVLKDGGLFGFISSNKFMRSNYGGPLRELIAKEAPAIEIVDFGELPVFHDASPFPAIFILEKTDAPAEKISFTPVRNKGFENVAEEVAKHAQTLSREAVSGEHWTLASEEEMAVLKKMESAGTPLKDYLNCKINYGIKTGFNEAFIIDADTRATLIKEDPKSEEIIKPLIVGDDVRRYQINYRNRYLIWTYKGIDIDRYPAILKHLTKYKKQLEKRWDKGDHWYELRACDYYEDFEKPKIVYPDISMTARFAYDESGLFALNTAYILPTEDILLLSLLNSRLGFFWMANTCSVLGDFDEKGRLRLFSEFLEKFPVCDVTEKAKLAEYARKQIQQRKEIGLSESLFSQHVNNYSPGYERFEGCYWLEGAYSDVLKKKMLIDSNLEGTVSAISVREEGNRLIISAVVDEITQDIAEMTVEDEDFRLFLYYSMRTFLEEHSQKKKWGKGKVAQVVLRALKIPYFRPHALDDPKLNLEQIGMLMKEFRAESPVLHITEAEAQIEQLERDIDRIVYDLYGLTEEEIAVVESRVP